MSSLPGKRASTAVDVHVHIGSFPSVESAGHLLRTRPDVAAFRTRHPELYQRFAGEPPADNSDRLVSVMDEHGVERALVQPRPGIDNEFVARLAARHPDRLVALALPTPWPRPTGADADPDELAARPAEAAATLRRCMGEFGMRAVGELYVRYLTGEIHPERIADALAPIFELLAPQSLPVELPTAWTQFPGGLYYGDPLWVDELAARYPTVPIVLTKMGRGLTRYFESCLVVAVRNANIYFDTSDTTPEHLNRALATVGPERIMFGTDWSATWQFLQPSVHEAARRTIRLATDDPGVERQILSKTAEQVFSVALASNRTGQTCTPDFPR